MLRLRTLGGLDLSAADDQVHPLLSQPKRLGLLVYLSAANAPGYRRRDAILPLFWPELDEDRARGALRQAMYVLRRDLGEGVIRARGEEEVGVDPAALWFDVSAFDSALSAGDYRTAAELYRGDFLDGFFVPGAGAEFDHWAAGVRSRLRGLASRTMWVVAEATAISEPAAAADWIRRAVALAPDDEIALRQALGQLERIGDRAGALQLYHEFRERLNREYQAEPATETKAMGEALRLSHEPNAAESHIARSAEVAPAEGRGATSRAAPAVRRSAVARFTGSPRRRAFASAVAVVLIASAWSLWRVRTEDADSLGAFKTTDSILVGDIAAQPRDSLNARALTYALRSLLAESRAIHVVSRVSVRDALLRMQLPETTSINPAVAHELALRNGYVAALTSELTPVGSGYVLSARLTSARGVELAAASEAAPVEDSLVNALGRLSKAVRSSLGESYQSLEAIPPLEQVTTRSIRALGLYSQAQDMSNVSRGNGQQPPSSMALWSEAIAIDSTFAMAHRRLGAALYNLGFASQALKEFRAAERFSDKLPDRERLTVLVSLHLNLGEYDRAAAEAIEILRLDPRSGFAGNWLAFNYFDTGQYDLAEEQIAMRHLRPLGDGGFWSNLREYQGRGDAALDSSRAFYRRYEDSTGSLMLRSARHQLAGFHAVHFAYDSALVYATPNGPSDGGAPIIIAASQFARGQLTKAIATQRLRGLQPNGELPLSAFYAGAQSFTALATMLMTSDRASASRRLDEVLADTSYRNRDPADRHIRPILALALVGRARDARRELTAIELASNADVRKNRRQAYELARGAVALAEHHPREAIAALGRASMMTTFSSHDLCRVCALPWLGRGYEDAGKPDSATMVYERYLTTGDPFRVLSDAAWRAFILRRLGELHAQLGDTAQAVKRLSEFVELWKDADQELQPMVVEARRRVSELAGLQPLASKIQP